MPRVVRLNIAPVRSLGLETRDEIDLGLDGVAEDRRFYVIDAGDRLVDQLTSGEMVQVTSWTNPEATQLRLTFPEGTVVEDDVRLDGAKSCDFVLRNRTNSRLRRRRGRAAWTGGVDGRLRRTPP